MQRSYHHLVASGAEWCSAVVLTYDNVVVCGKSALEVGAYRADKDDEQIFVGGVNAHLCACADEQRTYVERGAALVGRYKALVEFDHLLDHSLEDFGRQFGHQYAAASALQALSIVLDAESADFAVGAAEGFHALEGFLAVVQGSGSHVYVDDFGRAYFNLSPFAVAVVAAHIVVGGHVTKLEVGPINILHITLCLVVPADGMASAGLPELVLPVAQFNIGANLSIILIKCTCCMTIFSILCSLALLCGELCERESWFAQRWGYSTKFLLSLLFVPLNDVY